jgi:pimeloyl-ACP methyl ester carboxylesterase
MDTSKTPGTDPPFGPVRQIEAGVLNTGRPGRWPGGHVAAWLALRHSQLADVAPLLATAGYRVIVPFVRGYGTTRFLSDDTPRNGQQAAVAVDVTALMDALGIGKAILAGFDWGARSADVIAALWPDGARPWSR